MSIRAALGPLAALAVAGACSAPAIHPDLAEAEANERAGNHEAALTAYHHATQSCRTIRHERLRERTCDEAYTHRAELLERLERYDEALEAWEIIPEALPDNRVASARATFRAGWLHLQVGHDVRGYELLWKAVTHYPEEPFAGDALKRLLRDGRERAPRALYDELAKLVESMAHTRIADNVLFSMADLAEHELDDPAAALLLWDRLHEQYPESGLYDEAYWNSARLAREAGDIDGAIRRLRLLLDTREVAALDLGSYFSIYLDDAQLLVGQLLRDEKGELDAAAKAFRILPRHYPDSILRDDALYELAVTYEQQGEVERACTAIAELAKTWPDSKYMITKAPELGARRGCPPPAPPDGDDGDGDDDDEDAT